MPVMIPHASPRLPKKHCPSPTVTAFPAARCAPLIGRYFRALDLAQLESAIPGRAFIPLNL
jgi:hypothetical protein